MNAEELNLSTLPSSWVWATLGEIGTVKAGGTPSTGKPENFGGDVPWITPADLTGYKNKFIGKGRKNLSEKGLNSSSAVLLPQGTVLFSSRAPIGYTVIAENPVSTNQGFKNLICYNGIFNEYVFHYLKGSKKLAESYGSGTTFKEVSASRFAKIPIPLAPESEQHRIVSKVEELFSFLDAGVESLRKVQAQLKRYRQAVLKYAFEGKMSGHNSEDQNVQVLLSLIREERQRKWGEDQEARKRPKGRKYKESETADNEKLPPSPSGWMWVRLEELCSNITDGTHITPKYFKKGIPFLSVKNVREGKILDDEVQYISELEHQKLTRYVKPERDDILYTKVGATIGRAAVVSVTYPFSIFVSLALLKPIKQFVLSKFLEYQINSQLVYNQAIGRKKGIAVPDLHLIEIRDFKVLLAPYPEQERIVSALDSQFSLINSIEKIVENSLMKSSQLRRAILMLAFSGKLVPQDPTDEPAEKPLERIKSKRNEIVSNNNTKPAQVEFSIYVK